MLYLFDAQIAPGHNNVAGLTLLTSLAADSVPFIEVYTVGDYSRGEKKVKASGRPAFSGFNSKQWTSGLLWLPQWNLLANSYQGDVTVRTWTSGTSYANYNAILDFDEQIDLDFVHETEYGHAARDFVWRFTNLTLIP